LGDVKHKLMEEPYLEVIECRGIDSGREDFQVLDHSFEFQPSESGEDNPDRWRYRSVSSFGVRCRGSEMDAKEFELWQRRQASGHCLRWYVPRIRYIVKTKICEVA
jgi:hypothetical protein